MRRSLSSLADDQNRVLDAFSRDTPLGATQPLPHRGLIESLELATAALSEKEDIAASQRLAERFARQPAQAPSPPVRPRAAAIRPHTVAAILMILAAGGSTVYFVGSGASSKRAPERIASAAAIAPSVEDSLDSADERNAPPSRAFVPSQPTVQSVPAGQAAPAVSPAEEAAILKRGAILLKNGDVSAARLNFETLALRGSAKGAIALAQSFDPAVLRSMPIAGLRPDLMKAKEWYAKAAALGDQEATRRLAVLNSTW
jgi:hypothetical protein